MCEAAIAWPLHRVICFTCQSYLEPKPVQDTLNSNPQEAAMTDADRLTDFLFRSLGKAYCDDCLSDLLGIPRKQVQQQTKALAEEAWSKQYEGQCAGCGSTKLVIRRMISPYAA